MESNSSPSIQPSSFTRKRYQKHPTQTSTSKLNLSVTLNPSDSASCSMTSAQNLKQKQLINTYGPNSAFKCRASCKTLEFSLIKDYFFEVSGTNLILTKSIDDHNLKNAEDTEREEKDTREKAENMRKIRKIGNAHKKLTVKVNRKERNIDEEVCRSGSSDSTPHLYVSYKERLCGILLSYFN